MALRKRETPTHGVWSTGIGLADVVTRVSMFTSIDHRLFGKSALCLALSNQEDRRIFTVQTYLQTIRSE